jgi:hypothetical protein
VMMTGRVLGLLQAQLSLIVPLALVALVLALLATPSGHTLAEWGIWSLFTLWLPFVLLTLLSLAVHLWVDHKVGAHLLLITGWVVAVILDQRGVGSGWGTYFSAMIR